MQLRREGHQCAGGGGRVIIFNEGNPGRTEVLSGSLVDAAGNPIIPTIPVAFTSFAIGSDLLTQYQQAVQNKTALPNLTLTIQAIVKPNTDDYNVIADSKGGDTNQTVVVDAHLDAIYGAGMLDNGSGSATILDIAQMMKNVNPLNHLRFIWFGGEELGLLGSTYYVNNLSSNDLSHIGYDLDADVTATPNYIIGVLDPAAPDFFGGTVRTFEPCLQGVDSRTRPSDRLLRLDQPQPRAVGADRTDALSFNAEIPASGLLTGQDCCRANTRSTSSADQLGNYRATFEFRRRMSTRSLVRQPVNNDQQISRS